MDSAGLLIFSLLLPLLLLPLITKRRAASSKKKPPLPPSPPKLPLLGNLLQLGSLPHRSLRALSATYGPLMLLRLGQVPTLVVSSAGAAREVLRTHDATFAYRPSTVACKILLPSDMCFAPYNEFFKQTRKLLTVHLLSTKRVQSYELRHEEEVAFMVERIKQQSSSMDSTPLNLSQALYFFANDVVCRVVTGKLCREAGRNALFRELIEENISILGQFGVGDVFPPLRWLERRFGLGARATRNYRRWEALLEEVIGEHQRQRGVEEEEERRDDGQQLEEDFVDILLSLQHDHGIGFELSKAQINGLLLDVFAGGTDTTYISLEWAMAELVSNPEAMKKLQDEVRGIVDRHSMVRTKDLSTMSYLKAVVKETLRLHPPAPLLLPRESNADCTINGYYIQKGAWVLVNAWAIGRDPEFWEAPDKFVPERFLGNAVDFKGNDFQYIPFGAGRRVCPGMQLGAASVELALANLMHGFDWELPPGMAEEELDMEEAPGLTTRRKTKLWLVPRRVSPVV